MGLPHRWQDAANGHFARLPLPLRPLQLESGARGERAEDQRRLSLPRLREHLEALVRVHGATRVEVLDELLNVNEKHFDGFLDLATELKVAFDVPNGMRADYLEPRHFEAMRGRVTTVSVSAESGVQRVVTEVVGKQLELPAIERAAAGASRAKVPLMVHFMIGLPGETAEEINGTLAFAADLFARHGARPAVQFATPLPGTALARDRSLPVVSDWGPRFQMEPTPLSSVSREDLLRFKAAFDAAMRRAEAPPRATLDVTYVCNNDCVFCVTGPRAGMTEHPRGQRAEVDRLRRGGARALDIGGGEPTLHRELVPLIRHARTIGFDEVEVTTNGRLCFYEDYAGSLVHSGITSIIFSVHGKDAATHALHVGVPEAFEQAVGGIRNAVRRAPAGVKLGMTTTLTTHNVGQLADIADLALSLGLSSWALAHLAPFGTGYASLAPDEASAIDATRAVLDRYGGRLGLSVRNVPPCLLPGHEALVARDPLRATLPPAEGKIPLPRYVADQRVRRPVCFSCPHAVGCAGFYDAAHAPDPAWLRPRG